MQEVAVKTNKIIFDDKISVEEWCEILDCRPDDLHNAMRVMGNSLQAVDDYLVLNRLKRPNSY